MPRLTARDALRLVAQETPDTPVIIVTGSLDEEIAAEYIKAGATDYVVKHHLERLGPAVQRALDLKRAREEQAQAEEARRQGEERFRALIEHGADAIALLGADGSVVPQSFGGKVVRLHAQRARRSERPRAAAPRRRTPTAGAVGGCGRAPRRTPHDRAAAASSGRIMARRGGGGRQPARRARRRRHRGQLPRYLGAQGRGAGAARLRGAVPLAGGGRAGRDLRALPRRGDRVAQSRVRNDHGLAARRLARQAVRPAGAPGGPTARPRAVRPGGAGRGAAHGAVPHPYEPGRLPPHRVLGHGSYGCG